MLLMKMKACPLLPWTPFSGIAKHTCVMLLLLLIKSVATMEVCHLKTFKASCPPGHVILITKAEFGRMEQGQCLQRDYYVGCRADVMPIMHQWCSGKTSCSVEVPNNELVKRQQCPDDLVSYLDADYSCLKVTDVLATPCVDGKMTVYLSQDDGFLAGYHTVTSPARRVTSLPDKCSLLLKAPSGQKINITLFEFHNENSSKLINHGQYQCIVYANIKEYNGHSFRENVVCGSGEHRQELVYSSKTNEITIEMGNRHDQNGPRFLLQYTATGCADPAVPNDMTLTRRGDQLDVRCNNTGQVWHLVCRESSWVGDFGNCTDDAGGMYLDPENRNKSRLGFPNGIVMAIIVGIVLGVMIGFCLLLVVYNIRRKQKKQKSQGRSNSAQRPGNMIAKYPDTTYDAMDPMLPSPHPDVTLEKGCHVIRDVTGTMMTRGGRDRDHVYEKPQSGMEVQCLLSAGHHKILEDHDTLMLKALENGDYGCQLHGQNTWNMHSDKFEMVPPPPKCPLQT